MDFSRALQEYAATPAGAALIDSIITSRVPVAETGALSARQLDALAAVFRIRGLMKSVWVSNNLHKFMAIGSSDQTMALVHKKLSKLNCDQSLNIRKALGLALLPIMYHHLPARTDARYRELASSCHRAVRGMFPNGGMDDLVRSLEGSNNSCVLADGSMGAVRTLLTKLCASQRLCLALEVCLTSQAVFADVRNMYKLATTVASRNGVNMNCLSSIHQLEPLSPDQVEQAFTGHGNDVDDPLTRSTEHSTTPMLWVLTFIVASYLRVKDDESSGVSVAREACVIPAYIYAVLAAALEGRGHPSPVDFMEAEDRLTSSLARVAIMEPTFTLPSHRRSLQRRTMMHKVACDNARAEAAARGEDGDVELPSLESITLEAPHELHARFADRLGGGGAPAIGDGGEAGAAVQGGHRQVDDFAADRAAFHAA